MYLSPCWGVYMFLTSPPCSYFCTLCFHAINKLNNTYARFFSGAVRQLGFARKFVATAAKFVYHPVNSPMGNDTKNYKSGCFNYDQRRKI